jgi:hypothetical protein
MFSYPWVYHVKTLVKIHASKMDHHRAKADIAWRKINNAHPLHGLWPVFDLFVRARVQEDFVWMIQSHSGVTLAPVVCNCVGEDFSSSVE